MSPKVNLEDIDAPKLKKVTGVIVDAEFREQLGDEDEQPTYANCVVLLIKEEESGRTYPAVLSGENIQDITGCKTHLTSGLLIEFAKNLRNRTAPLTLMVPDEGEITPDMIKACERNDNKEEDQEDENELSNPALEVKLEKFSVKKRSN